MTRATQRLQILDRCFPRHFRRLLLLASAATGCLVSVSCQTSGVPGPPAPTTYQSGHWTRISDKPPTYYPRGVASDSPTDWQSGEWFRICDASDTRYFIPFKLPTNRDRQSLVNEVRSLRTEDYRCQIAKEDSEQSVDSLKRIARYSPVLVPLNTAAILACCFGGGGGGGMPLVSPDDFECWLHNWKKDYGSR